MDFRKARNALFERVSHDALASQLSVSVATIPQARLAASKAHRTPPSDWQKAVVDLAEILIRHQLSGEMTMTNEAAGSARSK
jgi:hypothetical protein